MDIIAIDKSSASDAAPLVAEFRVELKGYKGVCAKPDVAAGLSEISEYLDEGFPSYAAVEDGMSLRFGSSPSLSAAISAEWVSLRRCCVKLNQ